MQFHRSHLGSISNVGKIKMRSKCNWKLTVQCSPVVIEVLSFLVTCSATYKLQPWETYPLLICWKALGCMIWIPSALSQSTRAIEAPRRMASNWSVTETSFYYYTQCTSASLNWTQHATWQNDTHCLKCFNTFACELWHFSTFNYSLDKTVASQIGSDFTDAISGQCTYMQRLPILKYVKPFESLMCLIAMALSIIIHSMR